MLRSSCTLPSQLPLSQSAGLAVVALESDLYSAGMSELAGEEEPLGVVAADASAVPSSCFFPFSKTRR